MKHLLTPRANGVAPAVEQNGRPVLNEHERLEARRQELFDRFRALGLVGQSPALLKVLEEIEQASQCTRPPIPVLITGETGVGKELVARAIHACDPLRNTQRFSDINCSAVSEEILESELFGHKRGAFTSATDSRKGLFRAADKGTVFLDVIETMSQRVQAELLRVVEDHRIRPVGDDAEPVCVDVRVIAATNVPMQELIARGFRTDLYYRLNVYGIDIPPLRERREDILLQAIHFLQCYRDTAKGEVTTIAPETLALLTTLPWRGNSRELKNMIWSALARKRSGTVLQMDDLQAALYPGTPPDSKSTDSALRLLLGTPLEVEQQLIVLVLNECNCNRARTARRLGISKPTLYKKLRKHGLLGRKPSLSPNTVL